MLKSDLLTRYNYDEFIPEKFQPWLRFEDSPPVGVQAPDFPLWDLQRNITSLSETWEKYRYTVVEFGSFT